MKLSDISKGNFYVKLYGKVNDVRVSAIKINGTTVSKPSLDDIYERIGEDRALKRSFEKAFAELHNSKGDNYSVDIEEVQWARFGSYLSVILNVSTLDADGEAPKSVKGEIHED